MMMPFSFVRLLYLSRSLALSPLPRSLFFLAARCALSCVLLVRLCQGDLSLLSAWHSLIFDWAKKGKRHKMFGPQMVVLFSALLFSPLLSLLAVPAASAIVVVLLLLDVAFIKTS